MHKDDKSVILKGKDGYKAVLWNICTKGEDKTENFEITLPANGEYSVIVKTVDEATCNPLKLWHDMGEPQSLTKAQTKLLRESAKPLVTSQRLAADKKATLSLSLSRNALVYVEINKSLLTPDRGFDYIRATQTL